MKPKKSGKPLRFGRDIVHLASSRKAILVNAFKNLEYVYTSNENTSELLANLRVLKDFCHPTRFTRLL